jgi:hypothetical protein
MGIYWVFFDFKDGNGGGEMRLTQHSPDKKSAIKAATDRALKMHSKWAFREVQACR